MIRVEIFLISKSAGKSTNKRIYFFSKKCDYDLSRGGINFIAFGHGRCSNGYECSVLVNLSFVVMDFLFVSVIQVVCLMRRIIQNSRDMQHL